MGQTASKNGSLVKMIDLQDVNTLVNYLLSSIDFCNRSNTKVWVNNLRSLKFSGMDYSSNRLERKYRLNVQAHSNVEHLKHRPSLQASNGHDDRNDTQ